MKSPMVQNATYVKEEEKGQYSELQVLYSNAGWYVGTIYTDKSGFSEPGSRDSDYFKTREEAVNELFRLQVESYTTRHRP